MVASDVPGSFEEVTASWMAAALGRPGRPAAIESVDVEPLGPGVGFLGDVARVGITWASADDGSDQRPSTVIVKLPPADPGGRQVGTMLNVWAREQAFYQEVAPAWPEAQVPGCHHAEADPEAGRFVLLLDDCPSEPLDTAAGATDDQARAGVDALAAFHGHWWGRGTDFAWMPGFDRAGVGGLAGVWLDAIPVFLERYGHLLPDGTGRWLEAAPDWLGRWSDRAGTEPLTVVHADYRLDNLRYHDGRVTILDWQTALRGPGPMDLSSLVVTGCTIDDRRRLEPELIDRYRTGLEAAGVDLATEIGPGWLERSYDENLLWWMGQFASNLARLEPDEPAAQAALDTMIERTYVAGADREVGRLLG